MRGGGKTNNYPSNKLKRVMNYDNTQIDELTEFTKKLLTGTRRISRMYSALHGFEQNPALHSLTHFHFMTCRIRSRQRS